MWRVLSALASPTASPPAPQAKSKSSGRREESGERVNGEVPANSSVGSLEDGVHDDAGVSSGTLSGQVPGAKRGGKRGLPDRGAEGRDDGTDVENLAHDSVSMRKRGRMQSSPAPPPHVEGVGNGVTRSMNGGGDTHGEAYAEGGGGTMPYPPSFQRLSPGVNNWKANVQRLVASAERAAERAEATAAALRVATTALARAAAEAERTQAEADRALGETERAAKAFEMARRAAESATATAELERIAAIQAVEASGAGEMDDSASRGAKNFETRKLGEGNDGNLAEVAAETASRGAGAGATTGSRELVEMATGILAEAAAETLAKGAADRIQAQRRAEARRAAAAAKKAAAKEAAEKAEAKKVAAEARKKASAKARKAAAEAKAKAEAEAAAQARETEAREAAGAAAAKEAEEAAAARVAIEEVAAASVAIEETTAARVAMEEVAAARAAIEEAAAARAAEEVAAKAVGVIAEEQMGEAEPITAEQQGAEAERSATERQGAEAERSATEQQMDEQITAEQTADAERIDADKGAAEQQKASPRAAEGVAAERKAESRKVASAVTEAPKEAAARVAAEKAEAKRVAKEAGKAARKSAKAVAKAARQAAPNATAEVRAEAEAKDAAKEAAKAKSSEMGKAAGERTDAPSEPKAQMQAIVGQRLHVFGDALQSDDGEDISVVSQSSEERGNGVFTGVPAKDSPRPMSVSQAIDGHDIPVARSAPTEADVEMGEELSTFSHFIEIELSGEVSYDEGEQEPSVSGAVPLASQQANVDSDAVDLERGEEVVWSDAVDVRAEVPVATTDAVNVTSQKPEETAVLVEAREEVILSHAHDKDEVEPGVQNVVTPNALNTERQRGDTHFNGAESGNKKKKGASTGSDSPTLAKRKRNQWTPLENDLLALAVLECEVQRIEDVDISKLIEANGTKALLAMGRDKAAIKSRLTSKQFATHLEANQERLQTTEGQNDLLAALRSASVASQDSTKKTGRKKREAGADVGLDTFSPSKGTRDPDARSMAGTTLSGAWSTGRFEQVSTAASLKRANGTALKGSGRSEQIPMVEMSKQWTKSGAGSSGLPESLGGPTESTRRPGAMIQNLEHNPAQRAAPKQVTPVPRWLGEDSDTDEGTHQFEI